MEGYTMKKLLIAALAVSALVQTGQAASRRGVRRPAARPIIATVVDSKIDLTKGKYAQSVKTAVQNIEKAFKTLNDKTETLSADARRFIDAEEISVATFTDAVEDLTNATTYVDENFIKDVVSEDQIKEIQAKTTLYNTVVSVLGQLDSQVKTEMNSIRNAANKDAAVIAAREESIKTRAQNMLIALAFHDTELGLRRGEKAPVLGNMCAIARMIQNTERVENTDILEESVVARLKSEKRFLEAIGLATSRGEFVNNVSYKTVVSILTANLLEYVELSKKLHAVRQNGSSDVTKIAKEIVVFARKADDAVQTLKMYDERKANVLNRAHGLNNQKRVMVIMQTLNKLEEEMLNARKNLFMYDFEKKSTGLQMFYDRYYRNGVIAEKTSWLKPFIGFAAVAFAGYYLFGTEQGKDQVESFRKALPKSFPGSIS
jgi:hypothetical protein